MDYYLKKIKQSWGKILGNPFCNITWQEYGREISHDIKNKNPCHILEIGVAHASSTISFLDYIFKQCQKGHKVYLTSIDITYMPPALQRYFNLQGERIDCYQNEGFTFLSKSSLDYLRTCDTKFGIVLIDGDHTYYTIFNELVFLQKCLCDALSTIYMHDAAPSSKYAFVDRSYLNDEEITEIYDIPVNQEVYKKAKKDFLENQKLTKKGCYNAVKDFCDMYSFRYEFKKSITKIISCKK